MGFLKNMSIITVTTKRTRDLYDVIKNHCPRGLKPDSTQPEIKDALRSVLYQTRLNLPFDIDQASWFKIFCSIVAVLVVTELSYDPTIGSEDDKEIIIETITKELKKLTK